MKKLLIMAVFSLIFCGCSSIDTEPAPEQKVVNEVTEVLNKFHRAFNKHDAAALSELVSAKIHVVVKGQYLQISRSEYRDMLTKQFKAMKISVAKGGVPYIRVSPSGKMVWVVQQNTHTWQENGKMQILGGSSLTVLENRNGKWLVVSVAETLAR